METELNGKKPRTESLNTYCHYLIVTSKIFKGVVAVVHEKRH